VPVLQSERSGPGVPEQFLQRLFDPFFRVDDARTRETGGVGLGLTIVRTCVEACGGTVACRNRQPSGLEVTLRFNLEPEAGRIEQVKSADLNKSISYQ
jgi:signal transduction histidine kinase